MNANEIKGKGSSLLIAMGIIFLIFGILAGIGLIIEGGNSTDAVPIMLIVGFAVLLSSIFYYAFAKNIANINTNIERLCFYKEIEINKLNAEINPNIKLDADGTVVHLDEKQTMEKYGITKNDKGYYLVFGAKHKDLSSAVAHAKKDIENMNRGLRKY